MSRRQSTTDTDEQSSVTYLAVVPLILTVLGITVPTFLTSSYLYLALSVILAGVLIASYSRDDVRAAVGGIALFFIVGFAFWAPMWQEIVYTILVQSPGIFQWLIIAALLGLGVMYLDTSDSEWSLPKISHKTTLKIGMTLVACIALFALVGAPWVGGMYAKDHTAHQRVMPNSEEIDTLPNTTSSQSRIVPKRVASKWAENSLQYPQYTTSEADITYLNQTPHWSYGLEPNGPLNTLTKKQHGAVFVNQSTKQKDIKIYDQTNFTAGIGMGLTDSYSWQLARHDYLKNYKDPFVVPHKESQHIAVPYVTHEWKFRLTPIPQVYSVPKFGGVKMINADGNIKDLSPKEAQQSPVLKGQNYYPYDLARFKVASMAYKNGIGNTILGHSEQLQLAPVPGDGNTQPFTVPTEEGIKYFVAVEPWGDKQGVYQIWTLDAQTGDMEVMKLPKESALTGPRKAVDSVMGTPQLSRLTDVKAVEPIPVVVDDTLYWQVRIIPKTSTRITYIAFYNAGTEDVTVVETTSQVNAFLKKGENVSGVNPAKNQTQGQNSSQSSGCDTVLVIEYDDPSKETKRICVDGGVSIEINDDANTTNSTGTANRTTTTATG